MATKQLNEHVINNVSITLLSHREFYDQTQRLRDNYEKRHKAGKFDITKAIIGIEPFVYAYLKSKNWTKCFDPSELPAMPTKWERLAIAQYIFEHWEQGYIWGKENETV